MKHWIVSWRFNDLMFSKHFDTFKEALKYYHHIYKYNDSAAITLDG